MSTRRSSLIFTKSATKERSGQPHCQFPLTPSAQLHSHRFGESAVDKMVKWAEDHVPNSTPSPTILEIGSGNGTLLFALHEAGYSANKLSGIDYSLDAVQLAQSISKSRETEDADQITFTVCDFLNEVPKHVDGADGAEAWDVLMDKGTYDAIALGAKDDKGRSPAAKYPERAIKLLKPGGLLLITCTCHASSSVSAKD